MPRLLPGAPGIPVLLPAGAAEEALLVGVREAAAGLRVGAAVAAEVGHRAGVAEASEAADSAVEGAAAAGRVAGKRYL